MPRIDYLLSACREGASEGDLGGIISITLFRQQE